MSPLRWMQSTALHCTVMLEEVTSNTLTEVGAKDGAGEKITRRGKPYLLSDFHAVIILPVSCVIPVILLLVAVSIVFMAFTVMV